MGQDSSFPKAHHTPEQSRLGRVLSSYSERYALQPRAVDRENPSVTGRQAHRQAGSGASSQENITTRRLFSVVWVRLGRDFPTSRMWMLWMCCWRCSLFLCFFRWRQRLRKGSPISPKPPKRGGLWRTVFGAFGAWV